MDVYKLTFDAGGSQESTSLEELQNVKATVPGTITALKRVFYVVGDDSSTGYEQYQEAEDAKRQLQTDTYYVEPLDVVIDPQPEGLNP